MLESPGCCSQQPRHHFRILLLLLLSISFMARPTQSVAANLGIQDPTIYSRRLRSTSSDDTNWRGDFVSKPPSTDEPNWRAFMSQPASVDEANWRDTLSKAAPSLGAVLEIGLLDEDGSMSEAFFVAWDEDSQRGKELLPPEVESPTMADYSNASRFVIPKPENKVKDVIPCQESMQDLLPARQEEPCLVTVPSHYVRQYKWPLSQLKARVQNVQHSPLLKSRRSRAWVHVNTSTIFFLPGGPMYPKGAESYLDHLMQLVPELGVGTTTRVALDLECGTGSLSRVLGMRGVTTLCVAAYDSLENGVQLVMERGFPGLLAHIFSGSGMRLPYPSQAFDLLHCAACNISWPSNDGTRFFEADRILRSGGFFVWNMDLANQGVSWSDMAIQAEKLCWKLVIRNHQLAVWRKPANMTSAICSNHTRVPLCNLLPAPESESKWKVVMKPCLENTKEDNIFPVDANWTSRLLNPPKRLKIISAAGLQRAKEEAFLSDFNYWIYLTDFYVRSFGSSRVADIRNVLDVNAGYGSFAAALALRNPPVPWWVLNVVPVDQPNRLPIIFDRGLLGLYHDWCEPLDSYARTFDLVHASRFFAIQHRCSAQAILLEIDRLLRPGGFALFRDHKDVLLRLQKIARVLHWKAHIDDTESGTWGTDKLLHCQKTRWTNGFKPK